MLTRTEYNLLELLLRSAGRVVPREQIIETVWGYGAEVESNTLDAFVSSLRSKVDPPSKLRLIHTVRGVGYSLPLPRHRNRSGKHRRTGLVFSSAATRRGAGCTQGQLSCISELRVGGRAQDVTRRPAPGRSLSLPEGLWWRFGGCRSKGTMALNNVAIAMMLRAS